MCKPEGHALSPTGKGSDGEALLRPFVAQMGQRQHGLQFPGGPGVRPSFSLLPGVALAWSLKVSSLILSGTRHSLGDLQWHPGSLVEVL